MTDEEKAIERGGRAIDLLRTIVREWESDPMSVQCFDLRVVAQARALVREHDRANAGGAR